MNSDIEVKYKPHYYFSLSGLNLQILDSDQYSH